ncbi:hypothetical protein [Streptomyces sp. Y1]|uniref:Uncharacterized protein n=1 Tax=Streptomyces sp. Y1 TaxID=3238634 RepID=A0AB39TRX8_9ACTN
MALAVDQGGVPLQGQHQPGQRHFAPRRGDGGRDGRGARRAVAAGVDRAGAEAAARRRSAALIGLAGAVGAFGGVLVNLAFRQTFQASGNGDAAYLGFLAAYLLCSVLTWAVWLRRR